ncbi:MAG: bifunctional serine/threonine-protein kinase/formylglycine-generating enzyme family protein [Cyanobacteria bacterium J06635_10]
MTILAGRYEIIRQLGGGGFALTFLAKDIMQPSKTLCVVKQLRPNQTHERIIEFFNQEAVVLEKLGKYDRIPQLLAHFQEDDNLYIVQEFIEGHDLNNEICEGKRLSEAYVRELLQDVLEVLSLVHQQGVIHRDIKPHNLMRCENNGEIYLIDFGAVKEIGSLMLTSGGEIVSSMIIGTPGYMPNEQNNGRSCLASDIYALGMTAIKALTGIKPSELQENPETGEVVWLEQVKVSQHLGEVITKMVRRHHSMRYSCAKDVLQALGSQAQPNIQTLPIISPSILNQLSRRKILQILGLAGGSFLITVGVKRLFTRKLSLNPNEVVTVDASGNIINRQPLRAEYLTEDLGNGVTLEMAAIPGGKFIMGSPASEKAREDNESPQHEVTVQRFFMAKFPITQAQYKAIMGENPSYFQSIFSHDRHPVDSVAWRAAVDFCEKLTKLTKREYRLPSEAEWEYACRALTMTPFHFGETITTDLANYNNSTYASESRGNDRNHTTEVGIFPPNAFGLYDMHGNVWEWCEDTWHPNYDGAPTNGSAWINNNSNDLKVLRGGSWNVIPAFCRSAKRRKEKFGYDNKERNIGFRVVCSVAPRTL